MEFDEDDGVLLHLEVETDLGEFWGQVTIRFGEMVRLKNWRKITKLVRFAAFRLNKKCEQLSGRVCVHGREKNIIKIKSERLSGRYEKNLNLEKFSDFIRFF